MKKIYGLLVLVIMFMMISGCVGKSPINVTGSQMSEGGQDTMEYIEMSDEEKTILSSIYPEIAQVSDEDELFPYQREALYELRVGIDYLQNKYPGYNMQILSLEPANQFTLWATVRFQCDSMEVCKMTVTPSDNGYDCKDNFYGLLIREDYDAMVESVLADLGYQIKSYTKFPNVVGSEIGVDTTVSEMLHTMPELNRNTHLFIDNTEDFEKESQIIQDCLHKERLYGSYTLYSIPDGYSSDVMTLEANHIDWERITFNCFDID